jgi:endonuclease G
MLSLLLSTKCDQAITQEAATTGDTLHENADRTRNEADNSATFLMSNMMPQVPELNRGVWGDLEEYCRELVQRRARNLTSPAGPVGRKSNIDSSRKSQWWQRIGKLSWCWIDRGWGCRELHQTLKRDRRDDAQLGQRQGQGVEKLCLVPVKQVERETGLNFLSNVLPQVQQVIESKVDSQ